MRLLAALLLLVAAAAADNWAEADVFRASTMSSSWSGTCTKTPPQCNTTTNCQWPGVAADASCDLIEFAPAPPPTLASGQPYPAHLMRMSGLQKFKLSGFRFSSASDSLDWVGFSPSTFFAAGAKFAVEGNDFGGASIPSEFNSISRLFAVSLRDSNFGGAVPQSWAQASAQLDRMDISGNQFLSLPAPWSNLFTNSGCVDRPSFDISRNRLSGVLPFQRNWWSACTKAPSYNASRNQFTALVSFTGPLSLAVLDISDNRIAGALPNWALASCKTVDVSRNRFSGSWPLSFTPLLASNSLNLAHNSLSGAVPIGVGGFPNPAIARLEIQNNSFSGRLPQLPCLTCAGLQHLDVSYNQFTGAIWDTTPGAVNWTIATAFRRFYANDNLLSGSIPSAMAALPNWEHIDLSRNALSGTLPNFSLACANLKILRVGVNNLGSAFPEWVVNCTALEELDLSNNRFTGKLPAGFGLLAERLSECDISGNPDLDTATCAGVPCVGCPASCPTNDCAASPPAAGLVVTCCAGKWRIDGNASASATWRLRLSPSSASSSTVVWEGDYVQDRGDSLIVDYTQAKRRQRQGQDSLLKVDGSAVLLDGAVLSVVLPDDNQALLNTMLPVIEVVNGGQLTGQYSAINVTLPPGSCKKADIQQNPTAAGLSIVISFDASGCPKTHSGLSTKAVIGIVIGCLIVAIVVVGVVAVFALRKWFPHHAQRMRLKKSPRAISLSASTQQLQLR